MICAPVPEIGTIIDECEALGATEVDTPDAWTHEEASLLLEVARVYEPHFYAPFRIALATGMRRGELIANSRQIPSWRPRASASPNHSTRRSTLP